jgi:hypothetical protein
MLKNVGYGLNIVKGNPPSFDQAFWSKTRFSIRYVNATHNRDTILGFSFDVINNNSTVLASEHEVAFQITLLNVMAFNANTRTFLVFFRPSST